MPNKVFAMDQSPDCRFPSSLNQYQLIFENRKGLKMWLTSGTKVALTGHTRGIGQAIAHALVKRNCEVIGMSRSNGFDLAEKETIEAILKKSESATVFINNAYYGWAQIDLLYALFEKWREQNRMIINISSNSGDGDKTYAHKYASIKSALDKASQQLNNIPDARCRVVNIRPGWVETNFNSQIDIQEPKLIPEDVAETLLWILSRDSRIHVPTITILPKPR